MQKIPTIFDRDWNGNRGVINKLLINLDDRNTLLTTPSEKLDGTNVRVTIHTGKLVQLEKRRNPSKQQKKDGKTEPWYVKADAADPADKYIWEAANNRK